ncbi:MAG: S1-like domain-containing RNA-binding protein [Cyclobacteriaceae bacterium]|nr:S1-like domain-containing RNA-binding protein [Cyclobacteriaceae bacterium]
MIELGRNNILKIAREVDFGLYLSDGGEDILLPIKYVPEGCKIGDEIDVFVYKDSEDRPIATTLEPLAKLDEFACLEVVDVNSSGAFLDWGLEKDLFVPIKEQQAKMKEGGSYVVKVCFDYRTERLIGVGKIDALFNKDHSALEEGQEVDLLIYAETDLGYNAVIDDQYTGLIYHNDVFVPLSVGNKTSGFVKCLRTDGKIDITVRPVGLDAIEVAKRSILVNLRFAKDGVLELHDKSDADEIKLKLGLSKKIFKKAIGGLYKEGKLSLEENCIKLIPQN